MKLFNLFRRPSRKALLAEIAALQADVAAVEAWGYEWQDHAEELKGKLQVAGIDLACANSLVEKVKDQRDQYDWLARDLANKLSAAQAAPAHILTDDHLSVLREVTGKHPLVGFNVDTSFTGAWQLIDADKPQRELPVGSAA